MLPQGSNSVIKIISLLDKLNLLIKYNGNSESLMWQFADGDSDVGRTLEEIDAKLFTDQVYRIREKERELQKILRRIERGN